MAELKDITGPIIQEHLLKEQLGVELKAHEIEKIAYHAGLAVNPDDAEFVKQEAALVQSMKEHKIYKPAPLLTKIQLKKVVYAGTEIDEQKYLNRFSIEYSAKALAKARGEKLELRFKDKYITTGSPDAHDIYRDYLTKVMDEMDGIKKPSFASDQTMEEFMKDGASGSNYRKQIQQQMDKQSNAIDTSTGFSKN